MVFFILAVQHERQPRNSATLRPENLSSLDSERILREAVGVFGYVFQWNQYLIIFPKVYNLTEIPLHIIEHLNLNFICRVPMDSMGLGATANTVQNLAKNFHYSQFQLSEIAAKGSYDIFIDVPWYQNICNTRFILCLIILNIAAAAAAASTGSLHPPVSSATISPLSSSILGSSRSSSLLSPPLIGKEEKMAAGISTSGLSAPCSSSHSIHAHPPVGAVGPMPHIGKNIGILSNKLAKLNVIVD